MIAPTATRVENSSDASVNERIRDQTETRIAQLASADPRELTCRLVELDQEWDIERALEFNFTSVVLAGTALGALSNRKWYLLPALAACFMMQHVMEGWCPPLFLLRRLGFRTSAEIDHERMALKVLRGDFVYLGVPGTARTSTSSLLSAIEE